MDMNALALSAARFGLDLSLKVTFLLSLALLSIYGLRRLSASARHLVAMLGLAGALALPLATAVVPSFSIPLVPSLLPAETPATPSEARTTGAAEEDSSPVESSVKAETVGLEASDAPTEAPSNKRRIVESIEGAKTAETRARRIEKAVDELS